MQHYGAKNLADSWRTVRKNTVQVAEDIPEDKYNFRVADETMTVGEMLAHLATSPHWAEQVHFLDQKKGLEVPDFGRYFGESAQQEKALTTKAAIVNELKTRGEKFAQMLESASDDQLAEAFGLPGGSKSRFEMLLGVKEHEMHHRGQLMQMQRMLGIVPHLTRARQERNAANATA